jgi:nitrate/nitrite transporter NarK
VRAGAVGSTYKAIPAIYRAKAPTKDGALHGIAGTFGGALVNDQPAAAKCRRSVCD